MNMGRLVSWSHKDWWCSNAKPNQGQGAVQVCTQPMRDIVTLQRLSYTYLDWSLQGAVSIPRHLWILIIKIRQWIEPIVCIRIWCRCLFHWIHFPHDILQNFPNFRADHKQPSITHTEYKERPHLAFQPILHQGNRSQWGHWQISP